MALIECGECGGQVSDKAQACPHCGAPAKTSQPPLVAEPPPAVKRSNTKGLVIGGAIVGAVVLVAVLIVVSQSGPARKLGDGRVDGAKIQVSMTAKALDSYYVANRAYPDRLEALLEDGLLEQRQLEDPWKQPLTYRKTGDRSYELCSGGEDGRVGSADDICKTR